MGLEALKERWFGSAEEIEREEDERIRSAAVRRGKIAQFLDCEYLPEFKLWLKDQRELADTESFIHEDLLIQKGARVAYKAVLRHLDQLADTIREES